MFELKSTAELKIEDPRGHSPETLRRLRQALASGTPADADDQIFYIHISPATQKITLLATWSREPEWEIARSA